MVPMLGGALNLVWLAICASVLGWTGIQAVRQPACARAVITRRFVAVLMFALVLFPAISDSDDILCFNLLSSHLPGNPAFGTALPEDSHTESSLHLARVLETLQSFTLAAHQFTNPAFTSALDAISVETPARLRAVEGFSGRAPPHISL